MFNDDRYKMKNIDEVLKGIDVIMKGDGTQQISGKLCFNSSEVEKGDIFVAVKGSRVDGHEYINDAVLSNFMFCPRKSLINYCLVTRQR